MVRQATAAERTQARMPDSATTIAAPGAREAKTDLDAYFASGGWSRPTRRATQLLLCLGDGLAAAGAVVGALWIWSRLDANPFTFVHLRDHAVWFLMVGAWMFLIRPAYRPHAVFSTPATAAVVARAVVAIAGLYMAASFLAPGDLLPSLVLLEFLALAGGATLVWRMTFKSFLASESLRVPVAVVGVGAAARSLVDHLHEKAPHKRVLAFVANTRSQPPRAVRDPPVIGAAELRRLVAAGRVSELVTAPDGEIDAELLGVLRTAHESAIDVVPLHALYERTLRRLPVRCMQSVQVQVSLAGAQRGDSMASARKRVIDVAAGAVGCVLLLVLLPLLAAIVWLDVGRPVFFRQRRCGFAGRPFDLIKLRTMGNDAEAGGPCWSSADDPRASRLGRLLRRSRLDEMPQFWNVLRGDMSLVGPRPERPEFVDELVRRIPCYRERLLVRPGLTGWAQVNYGYGSTVDDAATKLEYDLYYVKHGSLRLDAVIAWRTVWTMLTMGGS